MPTMTARSRESEAVEAPREVPGVDVFVLQRARGGAVDLTVEWTTETIGAQIRRDFDVICGVGCAGALHENMTIGQSRDRGDTQWHGWYHRAVARSGGVIYEAGDCATELRGSCRSRAIHHHHEVMPRG